MAKIVSIHSFRGGTGKSNITANVAAQIAMQGHRVGVIDTDMLRVAWGDGARSYPSPEEWVKAAIPFTLALSASDNGESLTVA